MKKLSYLVEYNGVLFHSVAKAAKAINMNERTLSRWIRNEFIENHKASFAITKKGVTFKVKIFN